VKKLILKIMACLLALVTGIAIVWASGVWQMLSSAPDITSVPTPVNVTLNAAPPTNDESGKIILRFKGFELSKEWIANFEVINYTAKPITYVGFKSKDRFDFCTLQAQKDVVSETTGNKIHHFGNETRSECVQSKAVILQTIEPNESMLFSVFKYEVQSLVNLKELKSAHIGFEFFVGDEKRREMLWSDEITFPEEDI
jgi:hypothetical protein